MAAYRVAAAATAAFYSEDDGWCDCAYCRNYRRALAECCPGAVRMLAGLGLRHDRALEICELGEAAGGRLYDAYYPVAGELLADGTVIWREDAVITLYQADSPRLHCPAPGMAGPYFVAVVSARLPWVLDERP